MPKGEKQKIYSRANTFGAEVNRVKASAENPREGRFFIEEWEAKNRKEKNGLDIILTLQRFGVAYFCGGYVRDFLINKYFNENFEAKDIDIATELTGPEIEKALQLGGFKTKPVGEQFSVIKAWRDDESQAIEVATFRKEEEYADGRHPEKVVLIRDPQKDAERRDFTINALFFDPVKKEVIDYVGGLQDLKNKVLKPVGDPEERLKEDYVRMLRYVRFRAKYAFAFSREVKEVIKSFAEKITLAKNERIHEELDRILKLPRCYMAVADLARLGLLQHILPEVCALKNLGHFSDAYHQEGDVFRHVLEVMRSFTRDEYVERSGELLGIKGDSDQIYESFFSRFGSDISWALLFHDIGKAKEQQKKELPDGKIKITFKGHEITSRDMADQICRRLRFSNEKREKILWLVENHMLPYDMPKMKKSKKRALLQHPWIGELLLVSLADELGNFPSGTKDFDRAFEALKEERARPPEPEELVDGRRLMEEFNLKPGPVIGKIKKAIKEAQLEDKIKTLEGALQFVREDPDLLLNKD